MIQSISIKGFHCRELVNRNQTNTETVLFLPGNLQEIESMQTFTNALTKNYHMAMVELPGYGAADPLGPTYDIQFLAECAEEYTQKTWNNRRFHLIACSYSSAVAIEYAKRFPDRLISMSLIGAMPDIPEHYRKKFVNLMHYSLTDKEKFAREFIELLTNRNAGIPRLDTITRAAIRKAKKNSDDDAWRFIYNTMRILSYNPGNTDNIKTPTLCSTGQHDTYVTPARCKRLAQILKNATYAEIPGCDHLFHLEKPMACINLVSEFITRTQHQHQHQQIPPG